MTYESVSSTQAVRAKYARMTFERKSMATKTAIERIALVAVAALGFGMVSNVPANAAAGNFTVTASVTNTTNTGATTAPIPQGTAMTANLTLDTAGALANSDSRTFTWAITNANGTDITSTCTFTVGTAVTGSTLTLSGSSVTLTAASDATPDYSTGSGTTLATVSCPSTSGGQYTITPTNTAVAGTWGTATLTAVNYTVSGVNVSQGTTRGNPGAAATGNQASVTVTFPTHTGSEVYRIVSSGVGSIVGATDTTGTSTPISGVTANWSQGLTYTNAANTTLAKVVLNLASTTAGIQTINVTSVSSTTGLNTALYSINVTWSALASLLPSASIVRHAPTSTVGNSQGDVAATATNYTATVDAIPLSAVKTSGTNVATIQVMLLNNDGTAATGGHNVSASVSGSGFVTVNTTSTAAAGSSRSSNVDLTAGSQNLAWVHVSADGTAGTGTVTITVTDAVSGASTVIGTETFTFYGAVSKLEVASTNYTIGRAGYTTGGASTTQSATGVAANPLDTTVTDRLSAFVIVAKDSNGAAVTTASVPTIVSSDPNVVTGGTCVLDAGSATYGSSTNGVGYYNCNFSSAPAAASGAKATLTVRVADPASTTGGYITTTVPVSIGGALAESTLAFDKTSYTPGEGMTITRTGKDASGNPVYDGASVGAVSFNKAISGSVGADFFVGGKTTSDGTLGQTVFAPSTEGDFTASLTGKKAATTALITATATVSSDSGSAAAIDAANEATDAANAATDAANAAAEAADAATAAAQDAQAAVAELATKVASLMAGIKAQITSLTNLVIKIQKKVRA